MSATVQCADFADLAAAVALDAVDAVECARAQRHAAECPDCARILEQFREAAAVLGASVPQVDPPARLRQKVLAAAERERPARSILPFRLRAPKLTPAWLAAAASMLVSVVALGWVVSLNSQMAALQAEVAMQRERAAQYEHVVGVLGSPQLAVRRMIPSSQAQLAQRSYGWAYLDPQSRTGMVTVQALPPLQEGRVWQLWFTCGSERVSGGLMWPDRYGNANSMISLPQDLQSCESMTITEEPWSGSKWPTSPTSLWGRLRED